MITQEVEQQIKTVALYIRKSRGDEDKDLQNHLTKLTEIAQGYEWEYEVYSEVASASSIDDRPKMLELLSDIDKQLFDAVLVMDMDRLTRGGGSDQERLFHHLMASGTKIVTGAPYSVLDPSDESDVDMLSMKSFFSNYEHRTIKKRFKMGKTIGAQRGNWVFGRAPFGYQYDKKTKRLKVDPHQGEIVRRVVKEFLEENKSSGDISWGLNSDGLLSQTGGLWNNRMINRLLQNDVLLGHTTYNKSQGVRAGTTKSKYGFTPYRELPKDEWKIVYNTHEALVSSEERKLIDKYYKDYNKRKAKSSTNGDVFDLSGLCESPAGLKYTRRIDARSKSECLIIMRDHRIDKSEYPQHLRVDTDLVRQAIKESVGILKSQLEGRLETNDNTAELESYHKQLKKLEDKYQVVLDSFDRIMKGFIAGLYDENMAEKLKKDQEVEQGELESQLRKVRDKIDTFSNTKNLDKLDRINKFQEDIGSATSNREINILYKSIIKRIICERVSPTKCNIKVSFL